MTCQINLWNEHGWELDHPMQDKVFQVVSRHAHWAKMIDIYPQERVSDDAPAWKTPGWLEWIVRVHGNESHGGTLTIGVLQRTKGAEFECHT